MAQSSTFHILHSGDNIWVTVLYLCIMKVNGEGKGHPRTGHEGPEGEYRYSPTLSLTSALDGVGGKRHAPGRFTPGKDPVPIV